MKTFKKFAAAIGYVLFFCGYFYVIFINFLCPADISTKAAAIKSLVLAFTMATFRPGIICFGYHYIRKLEKRVDFSFLPMKSYFFWIFAPRKN